MGSNTRLDIEGFYPEDPNIPLGYDDPLYDNEDEIC